MPTGITGTNKVQFLRASIAYDGAPLEIEFTKAEGVESLFLYTSPDGETWSNSTPYAPLGEPNAQGVYIITAPFTCTVAETLFVACDFFEGWTPIPYQSNTLVKLAGRLSTDEPDPEPDPEPEPEPNSGNPAPESGTYTRNLAALYIPGGGMRFVGELKYALFGAESETAASIGFNLLGNVPVTDQSLKDCMQQLGNELCKLRTTDVVLFGGTITRKSDNGIPGVDDGYTVNLSFDQRGLLPITGEKTTGKIYIVKFARNGAQGRPGFMELKYAMTTTEQAAYQKSGTVPARFGALTGNAQPAAGSLLAKLIDIPVANGLRQVFPTPVNGLVGQYRDVVSYRYNKITVETPPSRKLTAESGLEAAVQKQINFYAGRVRRALRPYGLGTVPASINTLVNQIRADAQAVLSTLPTMSRARINIPPELLA